jgi:hypothetical protein
VDAIENPPPVATYVVEFIVELLPGFPTRTPLTPAPPAPITTAQEVPALTV